MDIIWFSSFSVRGRRGGTAAGRALKVGEGGRGGGGGQGTGSGRLERARTYLMNIFAVNEGNLRAQVSERGSQRSSY